MTKNRQRKKRIVIMIMGCFLLLVLGSQQAFAAVEASTRSKSGIEFVRDEEEEPGDGGSGSGGSGGGSGGAPGGNQGGSNQLGGNQSGGKKPFLPTLGATASSGLLVLLGLGILLWIVKQKQKKNTTENETTN